MMEMKKPTSLDDPSATASVLRRLTRTPTGQRLGLRRTSTATSSFTTSSVSSLSSLGYEQTTLSCASRNTSSDDCALSNFIVWVAVKRNACQKMTPEERRECPLLHCRKRFPNHELMLNHLYDCPHLSGGEYWCYDCGRCEKLGDSKCRRCLGHASKRRRLISMAKKVFGSLGNRAKGNNHAFAAAGPAMSGGMEDEPPSYDSVCPFELPLNEIHEIDSNEVSLPMIQECEPEPAAEMLFMLQPDFALGHGLETATGRQASSLDAGFINWGAPSPLPPTVAPQNLMRSVPVPGRASDRPALQLHTHGLDQYRPPQARRRSKTLAPSSSVRSTSSTESADSADSAESYNISPMSGWSRRWGRPAPGFESALTSPCDDSFTPEDGLPMDTVATSSYKPLGFSDAELDTIVANSFLSQQSADIPTIEILSSDPLEDDLDLGQLAESPRSHSEPQAAVMDGTDILKLPLGTPEVNGCDLATTRSLVTLVRDALQVHMAESTVKLRRLLGSNPLAGEFSNESPASVVLTGFQTMADLLEGRRASPKDMICFCHVVYCLSLLAHEQDMASLHKSLFRQALTYGHWFSPYDRPCYLEVVYSLWKPDEMSDTDIAAVLVPPTGPVSGKGKEPEGSSVLVQGLSDPLVFLAQYFLDELEYSALGDSMLLEILASDLTHHHIADADGLTRYSSFSVAAGYMIQDQLLQRYSDVPGFVSSVKRIAGGLVSGYVSAPRRLELELMQAGKMHLPPQTLYDDYVGHVRQQMDLLCAMQGVTLTWRQTYHAAGIKLMQQLLASEDRVRSAWTWMDHGKELETMTGEADLDLDALINFGPTPPPASSPLVPNNALAAPRSTSDVSEPSSLLSGRSRDSLAASAAPPRPSSSSSASVRPNLAVTDLTVRPYSPATATIRVESDSCCDVCGYRPKGDPRWFAGSMAKHQKIKHGETRIYQCPYPGCTSQYTNRPDNLQQHQLKKNHFVLGQTAMSRRNRKREWAEDG